MISYEVTTLVFSTVSSLEEIERVLGRSAVGGHTIGSARANGLARKQSKWVRNSSFESEVLEEAVDEALDWLCARFDVLKEEDHTVSCKIWCMLRADVGRDGFVVNPRMASKLVDLGALLHLDIERSVGAG